MRLARGIVVLALVGCSTGGSSDGGAEAGDSASGVKMSGTVISYAAMAAVPMATVAIMGGGASAVTDSNGVYVLTAPKGTAFSFNVTADNYTKLIEQETVLSGDVKRDETLVDRNSQGAFKTLLPGLDTAKAVLIVGLYKRPTCASNEGAVVELDPPQPGIQVRYTQGGLPSAMRTYAADSPPGKTERVIFYNIDPKATVRLKVSWAPPPDGGVPEGGTGPATPCKMVAPPFKDPDQASLTYTGNVVLEAGEAFTYERLYFE